MIKNLIQKSLQYSGYQLIKRNKLHILKDMEPAFLEIYQKCRPYTMTSPERMYALYKAIQYIVRNNIPGDIVECGVWKGGSSMLAALSLKRFNDNSRKIYLFDTFEGMSEPTNEDVNFRNEEAFDEYAKSLGENGTSGWCNASIEEVKKNMTKTGYPSQNTIFVKGKVEDTIPLTTPKSISVLRLDTDWYESTLHELKHLYPKITSQGVLIIDDYGHWQGARKATDQYFNEIGVFPLLNRIDYTGRMHIKPSEEYAKY